MLVHKFFVSLERYRSPIPLGLSLMKLGLFLFCIQVDKEVARMNLGTGFKRYIRDNPSQIGADCHSVYSGQTADTIHRRFPISLLRYFRRDRCRRRCEGARFRQFNKSLDLVEFHEPQTKHPPEENREQDDKDQKIFPERLLFHDWAESKLGVALYWIDNSPRRIWIFSSSANNCFRSSWLSG